MKNSWGHVTFSVVNYCIMTVLCLSILYPFVHLLSLSFSNPNAVIPGEMLLYPKMFTLDSYQTILSDNKLLQGYGNTLFRTVVGTTLTIIVLVLLAYPLSKKNLPHRQFYTGLFLFAMFFQGGMIPEYLLIKNLGLLDNIWVYVLPNIVQLFDLLIMRNFFLALPTELEESAKIDGASELRILFSIIVPISMPVIATVALWTAVFHWNSWFDSMLYINTPGKEVVQMYMRRVVVESSDVEMRKMLAEMARDSQQQITPESIKAAVLMVTLGPILLVYPFVQKYFVKGVMVGAVKG